MIELVVYRLLHLHYLFILHRRLGLYPQIRIIGVSRIYVLEVGAVERNVVKIVFSGIYAQPGFGPAIGMVFALYAVFVKPFIQRSHIAHIVHALYVDNPGQAQPVSVRLDVIFGILCGNKPVASLEPPRRVVPYITYAFFFSELGSYGLCSGNFDLPGRRIVNKPAHAEFVVASFRRTEHLFAQIGRNDRFHLYPVVLQLYRRKIYLYQIHFAVFAVGLKIEYIYSIPGLQPPARNAVTELKLVRLVLVKANRINFATRIVQVSTDVVVGVQVVVFLVRPGEYSVAVVIPVCLVRIAAPIFLRFDDYPYEIP